MQNETKRLASSSLSSKESIPTNKQLIHAVSQPTDSRKKINSDSRLIVMSGFLIILIFFGLGGLWISFAEIGGAVIASGEIRVDTERKTVQHLEGGIVSDILVRNGDIVQAGQPLMVMESARVVAGSDQLRLQIIGEELKNARLDAEKSLAIKVVWPPNDSSVPSTSYQELLESAQKVFKSGRQSLENQIDLFNKQIAQLKVQHNSVGERLKADEQVIATIQEELNAKLILFEEKFIDKTQILALQRAVAEHLGQIAQLHGSQAELEEKMSEFELRIVTLKNDYRQAAIKEQAEVQQHLFDVKQQLLPLLDARKRLTVTAPVAGEVIAMQVHSIGGVLSQGQAILDIVPENSRLLIVCDIQVKDITHVYNGQMAEVQLSAFNQRTTPKIPGTVVYISADRITRKTSTGEIGSYVVHIELDKKALIENHLSITAGMPATAFISTKPRTVLEYLIDPIMENFDRSLREN